MNSQHILLMSARVPLLPRTFTSVAKCLSGFLALVLVLAATPVSADTSGEVEKLTGAHTRVVWLRGTKDTKDRLGREAHNVVMGFDSQDGKGERVILSGSGGYMRPYLTPAGTRIIFSTPSKDKCYIVNFDGSDLRELIAGYAIEVWRDPQTGIEWVYAQVRGSDRKQEVRRYRIDNPGESELIWDQTEIIPDNFQLSADGTRAGSLFPWPHAGVAELPNKKWAKLGRGCWPSLAPDNSYLFWVFNGSHRDITMHDTRQGRKWKISIDQAPGIDRKEVYFPRWTNHVQYMTMSGPFGKGGPATAEVYVGRFGESFETVEQWVKLTDNDLGDYYPDVWIAGGENAIMAGFQEVARISNMSPHSTAGDDLQEN